MAKSKDAVATTINNAVLAVYISKYGQILAAEQLSGEPRVIAADQLSIDAGARSADEELLSVKLRVQVVDGTTDGTSCRQYAMMQVCYDKSGRRVPCF